MTAAQAELDAGFAASAIVGWVKQLGGARWAQGLRRPALPTRSMHPDVQTVATVRMYRLADPPARALVAWSDGQRQVRLLHRVPSVRELLVLQARGARCVSILDDDAETGVHQTRLAFALHDLCHLEKFVDPESHAAQVGFFARLDAAWDGRALAALHARYDASWQDDLAHVAADMNGSPVFLVAALKMKLKMAERRALARREGRREPTGGELSASEAAAFAERCDELLDALRMEGELRAACLAVSTRRDAEAAARYLHRALAAEGQAILGAASS